MHVQILSLAVNAIDIVSLRAFVFVFVVHWHRKEYDDRGWNWLV